MGLILELGELLKLRVLQLLALALLLTGLAGLSLAIKAPVLDADVWWHLKVGDWIVEHRDFPHVGLFSRTAATRPWMAYSWGYEVLLSRTYAWLGLVGIALFGVLLTAAVAGVLFWMLHRLSRSFWLSWVLCAAGCVSFLFNILPRPVFFSMMFFTVTLTLLLEAHRSGCVRPLYWLPVVFVFWANCHIQFVYGLFAVGLFVGLGVVRPIAARVHVRGQMLPSPSIESRALLGILGASVLASCIGPYSYHVFEVVMSYSRSKFPYMYLEELQSLDFQHPSDYVLVLLAVTAFARVVRRNDLAAFRMILLSVAAAFAFRGLRDAWFLGISAAVCIADLGQRQSQRRLILKVHEFVSVAAVFVFLLYLIGRNTGFSTRELDRTISKQYPVDAVNFVRRHPAPGPLYNDFSWGGFLIWYMPDYPVAIDGRTDLYGDDIDLMTLKSVSGDYASDPYLKEAGLVLLPNETPLASLLASDSQYRVVYSDRLAIVLVRNQ